MTETAAPDTEDRILEAAHRVFLKRGTAGARTQEIADEAGVNKALLHYYFRTKRKLSEAVFRKSALLLFPRYLSVLSSNLPLREKLDEAAGVMFDILEANPYLPGYVISEFHNEPGPFRELLLGLLPVQTLRGKVLTSLQRQLEAEAEAGRLRPTRAEDLVVSLMSQVLYPYAAAPMLEAALGLDEDDRAAMARRRRETLADDILRALAA